MALVPRVYWSHPNYAMVLLVEVIAHVGLAYAGWFGSHNAPIWYYFQGAHMLGVVAVAHAVIASLLLVGVYSRFGIVRVALLASVTVYTLQAAFLLSGVIRSYIDPQVERAALEGTIYAVGLILLSAAAYREPLVPGQYTSPDTFEVKRLL